MKPEKPFWIGGDMFSRDKAGERLVGWPAANAGLPFASFEQLPGRGWFRFYYDPADRTIYQHPPGNTPFPERIRLFEVNAAFTGKSIQEKEQSIFYVPNLRDFNGFGPASVPRELPRIKIHDRQYFADARQMAFIDPLNPENKICYAKIGAIHKEAPAFYYDTNTRNVADISNGCVLNSLVKIKLPKYDQIDPDGSSALRQLSLSGHHEWQLLHLKLYRLGYTLTPEGHYQRTNAGIHRPKKENKKLRGHPPTRRLS